MLTAMSIWRQNRLLGYYILLASIFGSADLTAQVVSREEKDTSLAAMVKVVRLGHEAVGKELAAMRQNDSGAVRAVLDPMHPAKFMRQEDGPQPLWKLEALADSMLAIALETRTLPGRPSPPDALQRSEARWTATNVLEAAWRGTSGRRLPSAFDRLVQLIEEVNSVQALFILTVGSPEPDRSVVYLRKLATSEHPMTFFAVDLLTRLVIDSEGHGNNNFNENFKDFRPYAEALLRELYREGSVKDWKAKSQIEALARYKGW